MKKTALGLSLVATLVLCTFVTTSGNPTQPTATSSASIVHKTALSPTSQQENTAQTPQSTPPSTPEIPKNVPEKGLIYDDLRKASNSPSDPCKGMFAIDMPSYGKNRPERTLCTRGPDQKPQNSKPAPLTTAATQPSPTSNGQAVLGASTVQCYGDGQTGRRAQAIYVVPSDKTDRYDTIAPQIQQWAAYMDQQLNASAQKTGGTRHIKWVTNPDCTVNVQKVVAKPTTTSRTYYSTVDDLMTQGYMAEDRKYISWVEDNNYCGIASAHFDDSADPKTQNSLNGPDYARIDTPCWGQADSAELHELMHTIGAVQETAPHGTGYGHCTDEYDLMCYSDESGATMNYICTSPTNESLLDCNNDDYFSTNPAPGSYLATHWNTANSWYLFDTAIVDTTPPSTPTNLRANYVRGNNVSLSWTGSTDAGTEVTYIVYRDGVRIGSTHDFTNPALLPLYHDWEVSPETTYTYKVTAVDEYGNFSTASNEITVTTPVLDTTPPTAPGFLHTTKITPNSYEVQWTASTDNIAVEKYRIEQNDVTYLFLPPTSTTFTNSYNVSPSTSYTVRVTAIDTSGNTAMSSITFTTPAIDNPPTAPTNLRIVSSTANSVTLQWDASTDDGRVEGYQLYRNGTARGGVYAPNLQIADSIVTPGQTYTYEVAAWDNASPTKNYSPKSNKVTVTIPSNGASPTNPTYTHPAYSPAMLQNENGETKAVAVGLDNGLYFYSNIKGSSVWEMQRISGPGTAFSTPVMLQRDSGEINIVVLGPGNTLFYYFNFQGDTTWGKLPVTPPGRAMSGASMLQRSDGETDVVVRGPNNSLRFYYNFKGNPAWGMSQVTNSNAAYSDPTMLQRPESGETDVVVRGPNNSLDFYFNFKGNPAWGRSNIRGGGAAFSTPKLLQRTDGESNVAVVGPNNKLDFYFNAKGSAIWGLSPAVSAGNAFNSPSMLQRPDGETNILLPGYNGRLDFYYNARGSGFWGRAGVNI